MKGALLSEEFFSKTFPDAIQASKHLKTSFWNGSLTDVNGKDGARGKFGVSCLSVHAARYCDILFVPSSR